jgi:hypothetical protein
MKTKHAIVQGQRRCFQPIADEALDRYGQEQHDGHGAIVVFMSKTSKRAMERDWGYLAVNKLWEIVKDAYKVITTDGVIITVGHRYQKIHRI